MRRAVLPSDEVGQWKSAPRGNSTSALTAYNLMSVFRHAVMRKKVHHTLSTLHHQVLAVGALWDDSSRNTKQTFRLAVARKRRPWFEGLWANAGEPVMLTPVVKNL